MPVKQDIKTMSPEQLSYLRGDLNFATCVSCNERKPVREAFRLGSKGICNLCIGIAKSKDQAQTKKRRRLQYEKELREINRDFPLERELA